MIGIIEKFTTYLWDNMISYMLIAVGILYTIRLGLPQILRLPSIFKEAFGDLFKKGEKKEGEVSSFQALATAVASQVGTGNIGGVASAIMMGGPGAVFWMWISGLLGMSTIFAEAVLAQVYREERNGEQYGGPAYYLSNGLKNKKIGKILAILFSIFIIIALGLVGNMVQSNSISLSLSNGFGIAPIITGIALSVIVGLIVLGGVQRISKIAETIVPVMAVMYILAGIVVVIKFHAQFIPVIKAIFTAAFSSKAVLGGMVGISVKTAMRLGLQRGLFSNEAGMGSTPHAHAVANVPHPVNQGFVAMAGVIIGTFFICTLTAFIILVTGAHIESANLGLETVEVTQLGFKIAFGNAGTIFLAIALAFFAFTTIIGWYYFGESNVVYLFGRKTLPIYRIVAILFVTLGTIVPVGTVWLFSDMFNALMVIPNLIGLVALSGIVVKKYDEWRNKL